MTERIVGTDEHEGHWYTGEEIVRCRDCACWYRGYCGRHSYEVANQHGDTYTEGLFPMDEDDFCSLGERMEVRE